MLFSWRAFFQESILPKNIGEHFWESKRAFLQNRLLPTVMLDFSDDIIFPHFWTVALQFASKTVQTMEHIGILLMPTKSGKMINQYIWSRPKKLPWLALLVTYPPHLCTIHSNFSFLLLYIAKTSEPIIICQNDCQVRIYLGGNDP